MMEQLTKRQKPCTPDAQVVQAPPQLKEETRATMDMPTSSKCESCLQTLPQHLFPKKKFAKNGSANICRQCKKNATAERCKQPTKAHTKQGRRSDSGVKRRPNNFGYCNYIDSIFSLKCFPKIVELGCLPSAKDVSESMAAIHGACEHGLVKKYKQENSRKNIMCLCIGDGSTPRTAVLSSFLKQWKCVSIDPALHEEWQGVEPKGVRGLTGFGGTLEEFLLQSDNNARDECDQLVLLCVHSHARFVGNASVPSIMAKYNNVPTTLISLPCCPKFRSQKDVGRAPDIHYEDDCVFSACRRVEVWNFDYTMCSRVSNQS